jgi:uncharacterized protein (UPF0332 family)
MVVMFNWWEYLVLARYLISLNTSHVSCEAINRTAISRAYYAAFCFARNYATQNLGFNPKDTNNIHKKLIDHYKNQNYKHFQTVSNNLNRLRKWRNQCDYNDNYYPKKKLVTDALSFAESTFRHLSN